MHRKTENAQTCYFIILCHTVFKLSLFYLNSRSQADIKEEKRLHLHCKMIMADFYCAFEPYGWYILWYFFCFQMINYVQAIQDKFIMRKKRAADKVGIELQAQLFKLVGALVLINRTFGAVKSNCAFI